MAGVRSHPGRRRQPVVTALKREEETIVTGAAGGIGRELVLGLLGKGLKLAAVDRTAQGLAELAQAHRSGSTAPI
jgi:short-subunit dehydrogenase